MIYSNLEFSSLPHRPYFITDFVSTVDGKVFVKKDGYWPIGSPTDYETFTYLRAHADAIIDGKNTALKFGQATIATLHSEKFKKYRKTLGKEREVEYLIMTGKYDPSLKEHLDNTYNYTPTVFYDDLSSLADYLLEKHHKIVFVDGGPTLLASFLKRNMLDEIFLTLSPKLYGSEQNTTLSLVENYLFPPDQIPQLELISSKAEKNEVFLRYKIIHFA